MSCHQYDRKCSSLVKAESKFHENKNPRIAKIAQTRKLVNRVHVMAWWAQGCQHCQIRVSLDEYGGCQRRDTYSL